MKYIFASTVCFIAIMMTTMFTWEATRRSADEWAKINQSNFQVVNSSDILTTKDKIQSCIDGGGVPNYDGGFFADCRIKD